METSDTTSQKEPAAQPEEKTRAAPAPPPDGKPVRIESDLDFIRAIHTRGGETYKKCFQCGNCSATCTISPDDQPFPRKEMAWAVWGMKKSLMADPDIWLCYQCADCTSRCPRGARPGDVLAAIRRESILHYAFPRFLATWVSKPHYIPLVLLFPTVLIGLGFLFKEAIVNLFNIAPDTGNKITYSYSAWFPHWFLDSFFIFFSLLALTAVIVGVTRFWRAMKASSTHDSAAPVKGIWASIWAVLKSILRHDHFSGCISAHSRYASHWLVFFGFLGLSVVTLWVITSGFNPIIRGDFKYPFGFLSPWKILANVSGLALAVGCILMILDRLEEHKPTGGSTYFDWSFVLTLLLVVGSGFATELLHYLRLEPHRHIVYFIHLVLIFVLVMNLPFSKFAHVVYRTTALVFAERTGRRNRPSGNNRISTGRLEP